MGVTLVLTSTAAELEREILKAAASALAVAFRRAAPAVKQRVGGLASELIQATDEYRSLLSGRLRGHMGLENPDVVLDAILRKVAEGVFVGVDPPRVSGSSLSGGLELGILRSDFQDVLSAPGVSYVSPSSGREIAWLDWMLKQGDRIVVFNYSITFQPKHDSRSGMALMFPNPGKGWRVPSWAAGVEDDNWLTRAFNASGLEQTIASIMQDEIMRALP